MPKFNHTIIECILKMFKQPILVEHCVQSNKVEYHVEINEDIKISIHNDIYNKKSKMFP